jgi:hypothetical protein
MIYVIKNFFLHTAKKSAYFLNPADSAVLASPRQRGRKTGGTEVKNKREITAQFN